MAISKISKMDLKTLKNPNDKTKLVFFNDIYPYQGTKVRLRCGRLIQVDLESSDILINKMTTSENTLKSIYRNSFSNELWKLTVTITLWEMR